MALRSVIFLLVMAALVLAPAPGRSQESGSKQNKEQDKDPKDIWTEERPRDERRRMELSDEEIARIIKSIRESDPKKAAQLEELRKKDREKFLAELRRHGADEFARIVMERIEAWRQRRRKEFLDWLGKNYPDQAKELTKAKPRGADFYNKKFDLVQGKYGYIYEAWRRNPELGRVLKQDLALKKRRDDLIAQIKKEKDDEKRQQLAAKLREVVADRYDLIVRRKQIAYDQLQKRLGELQKQINQSRAEIGKWRDAKFKEENVKQRIKELTEDIPRFKWN